MTPEEPPEFHTKTLSPLSPLPLYPPEPSKIPVLQNQTDPVFNMTSTYLDLEPPKQSMTMPENSVSEPTATTPQLPEGSKVSIGSSHSMYLCLKLIGNRETRN